MQGKLTTLISDMKKRAQRKVLSVQIIENTIRYYMSLNVADAHGILLFERMQVISYSLPLRPWHAHLVS